MCSIVSGWRDGPYKKYVTGLEGERFDKKITTHDIGGGAQAKE